MALVSSGIYEWHLCQIIFCCGALLLGGIFFRLETPKLRRNILTVDNFLLCPPFRPNKFAYTRDCTPTMGPSIFRPPGVSGTACALLSLPVKRADNQTKSGSSDQLSGPSPALSPYTQYWAQAGNDSFSLKCSSGSICISPSVHYRECHGSGVRGCQMDRPSYHIRVHVYQSTFSRPCAE